MGTQKQNVNVHSQDATESLEPHIISRYVPEKRVGKGAYGIVYRTHDVVTRKTVAVKKIFDAFRNATDAQRTFREISFLLAFNGHENIVRLLNIHKAINRRDLYLIFEYVPTDLHTMIKKNRLNGRQRQYIVYQLLKAVRFMHSADVLHRDLKPSNILLDASCNVKVCDFGLARSLVDADASSSSSGTDGLDPSVEAMTEYVATRWYRAPEILVGCKQYTKGVDIWSVGCIFAEMLLGEAVFPGSSALHQVELILAVIPPPSPEEIESFRSPYAATLIEKALFASAPSRLLGGFQDLLPHSSKEACDLLESLLVFAPSKRMTASEAVLHPYVAYFHRGSRFSGGDRLCPRKVVPCLKDEIQLPVGAYRKRIMEIADSLPREGCSGGTEWDQGNRRTSVESLRHCIVDGQPTLTRDATEDGIITGYEVTDRLPFKKSLDLPREEKSPVWKPRESPPPPPPANEVSLHNGGKATTSPKLTSSASPAVQLRPGRSKHRSLHSRKQRAISFVDFSRKTPSNQGQPEPTLMNRRSLGSSLALAFDKAMQNSSSGAVAPVSASKKSSQPTRLLQRERSIASINGSCQTESFAGFPWMQPTGKKYAPVVNSHLQGTPLVPPTSVSLLTELKQRVFRR
ncbi:unnamed protein product [Cyprideis torosa]|uniref:Mitogen-activated protein kinase n=1 Tax=Cyprideis torosa TaxID=163714 RepID=A0A7R8WFL5_9CRUS|nr:unnamed protein product [Cyprideis torosa]CAG0891065.1 unnamed protein product [Cyprideis torosa]